MSKSARKTKEVTQHSSGDRQLLGELRQLILSARQQVAVAINTGLTLLYWRIGQRIRTEVLDQKRATYGQQLVAVLAAGLSREFGRGFSARNLASMIRFAELYPDLEILQALTAKLGWTHFVSLLRLGDALQRDFYAEMCRIEGWSTRTLEDKIASRLYDRTALSRKPDQLIREELAQLREHDRLSPDLVFRDPYLLDFLGLQDTYSEKDLEAAILREMEAFILELGVGFTFVARQKRIQLDGVSYYLDLLFYHRHLQRLIAVELKLDDFKPADKGQMELYLAWLEKNERRPGEGAPLGLILCAGKRQEAIELLDLERSGIQVSSYWTESLPRDALLEKLHLAIAHARQHLENRDALLPPKPQSKPSRSRKRP